MKKILCLILMANFAYSLTGDDFLQEFPFGKDEDDWDEVDRAEAIKYISYIDGWKAGNAMTIKIFEDFDISTSTSHDPINIDLKTCGMSKGQIISLTKMWCDDNPDKTHFSFAVVVYRALLPLPTKSIKDCMER